jgi:hypothetical protein
MERRQWVMICKHAIVTCVKVLSRRVPGNIDLRRYCVCNEFNSYILMKYVLCLRRFM